MLPFVIGDLEISDFDGGVGAFPVVLCPYYDFVRSFEYACHLSSVDDIPYEESDLGQGQVIERELIRVDGEGELIRDELARTFDIDRSRDL